MIPAALNAPVRTVSRPRFLKARQLYLLLVLIPITSVYLLSVRQDWLLGQAIYHNRRQQCVSWRATVGCHPFGARQPTSDTPCSALVRGVAGYCECSGRITVARVPCGPHLFTCKERCQELAFDASLGTALPAPLTCNASANYSLGWMYDAGSMPTVQTSLEVEALASRSRAIWDGLDTIITLRGLTRDVHLPGVRLQKTDWVMEGSRLRKSDVELMRSAVHEFLADVPEYPASSYKGRGITMVGGGLKYMVPAWTSIHMLRRTGCRLPVEMWFPVLEYPTAQLEAELGRLGVLCRRLDERDLDQHGFSIKVAALLLSQFQETLFLDADNIALRDPTYLFDSEPYVRTGALFWPDYWGNTVAPDLLDVLGVSESAVPRNSFESGQMLVDKARHWRGLALATYMNAFGPLYYELLTCFLGKGDKETFGYGMLGAGEKLHLLQGVGSAGVLSTVCAVNSKKCAPVFTGNTMVQYDPKGAMLFMHANYEKQTIGIVNDFQDYHRRWQVLQPGLVDLVTTLQDLLGYDPEHLVFDTIVALRCAPWFDAYYRSRMRMGDSAMPPLDSFSPVIFGMQFDHVFRRGFPGEYEGMMLAVTPWLRVQHAYFGHVYPRLSWWLRWLKHLLPKSVWKRLSLGWWRRWLGRRLGYTLARRRV